MDRRVIPLALLTLGCMPVIEAPVADRGVPGVCVGTAGSDGDPGYTLTEERDVLLRITSIAQFGQLGKLQYRADLIWDAAGPTRRAEDLDGDGVADVIERWTYADGHPIEDEIALAEGEIAVRTARTWDGDLLRTEAYDVAGDGLVEQERAFTYDAEDRLLGWEEWDEGALAAVMTRTYGAGLDHVETQRAPDGTVFATYDRQYEGERPVFEAWESPWGAGTRSWRWDTLGRLTASWSEDPNGAVATQRTLDPRGLPTDEVYQADAESDGIWESVRTTHWSWSCGSAVAAEAPPDESPIP
jgi:hypothetical protein